MNMAEHLRQLVEAAGDGWDGIDNPPEAIKAAQEAIETSEREERMRQARIMLACFGTPEGRAALELLKAKVFRPPTQAELDERDVPAFALAQARLQGAGNVIWMIESALETARGEGDDAA